MRGAVFVRELFYSINPDLSVGVLYAFMYLLSSVRMRESVGEREHRWSHWRPRDFAVSNRLSIILGTCPRGMCLMEALMTMW